MQPPLGRDSTFPCGGVGRLGTRGEDGVVERERAGGEGDGWVVGGAWRGVGWVAGASMGRCPHVRRVVVSMLVGGGGEGGG